MTTFAIIGHIARTDGVFSLNDLPGTGGRMDVVCRCVNTSLFLSHDLRRDTECYMVLCGEPAGPKTVRFSGSDVRSLSPDERSAGALIKKALTIPVGSEFREGPDMRQAETLPDAFLLSDHLNFTNEEESLLAACPRYSVGPVCLHADHAITLVHNELDRRRCQWNLMNR
jgi:tRNA (pseudouridine54-N1)-methyltransferase